MSTLLRLLLCVSHSISKHFFLLSQRDKDIGKEKRIYIFGNTLFYVCLPRGYLKAVFKFHCGEFLFTLSTNIFLFFCFVLFCFFQKVFIYLFIHSFIYLFIYLFMAVLGLRFCARAFSSCGKWGPLFIAVHGPLTIAASLAAEHRLQMRRLSNCGSRAQLLRGMWDPP